MPGSEDIRSTDRSSVASKKKKKKITLENIPIFARIKTKLDDDWQLRHRSFNYVFDEFSLFEILKSYAFSSKKRDLFELKNRIDC